MDLFKVEIKNGKCDRPGPLTSQNLGDRRVSLFFAGPLIEKLIFTGWMQK